MRTAADIPFPSPMPWTDRTVLVCLNLQDEHTGVLRRSSSRSVARAIERMAHCLAWARANRLPVLHVLTPPQNEARGGRLATIASLKPKPNELIVYKSGLSLFDSAELKRSQALTDRTELLLIGFSLAADCIAAAMDSRRARKNLIIIEDAIASFDLPPYSAAESDGVIFALLAQFASIVASDDLPAFPHRTFARR